MTGSGFPLSKDTMGSLLIKIGDKECALCDDCIVSNTLLQCITPPQNVNNSVKIMFNGKLIIESSLYSYNDNNIPEFISMDLHSGSPVVKDYVNITGTKFGTDASKYTC